MNIQHVRYAVEVERTRSISKAAENLYIGQPNLSRAIKELEESLGITIFKRTRQGISLTPQGEEFMVHARAIVAQIDQVEALYRRGETLPVFSLSAPRSYYIAAAFTDFMGRLQGEDFSEVYYKETNAVRAVSNLLQADYKLGIIRYQEPFADAFALYLREKGLSSRPLYAFTPQVVLSQGHPLAERERLEMADLAGRTEIAAPDPRVPSLPLAEARQAEQTPEVARRIYVFERAIQLELLTTLQDAFLWEAPLPEALLRRYGLVQRAVAGQERVYRDVLIHRRGYLLSELDQQFLSILEGHIPC